MTFEDHANLKQSDTISIDGIRVRVRNTAPLPTSTPMMHSLKNFFDRDVFVTAVTVIPSSALWITTESLAAGFALGIGLYVALEYGYPLMRSGKITLQPLTRALTFMHEVFRARSESRT